MPAKDKYHNAVKQALIKAGWIITADPYILRYEEITVLVDLGAERLIAAECGGRKIAVEIKSFLKRSPVQDLKETLGQYELYCGFLEQQEPERQLYIAIPQETYEDFFQQKAIRFITQRANIPLLIVDMEQEEIVTWIKEHITVI